MIGKPVALIQVPNQRLFSTKAATQYLGVHPDTLRKYADLGHSPIRSPRSCFALTAAQTLYRSMGDRSGFAASGVVKNSRL